jgi:hypothetical protein
MVFIMAEDLAMLSEVHFIMAEAGVKANVESTAAAINILISDLTWKGNQRNAGYRDTHFPPNTFPEEDIFVCCGATRGAPDGRACAMHRRMARSRAACGNSLEPARMIPAAN